MNPHLFDSRAHFSHDALQHPPLQSLNSPLPEHTHRPSREAWETAAEWDLTMTNWEEVGGAGSGEGKKECCVGAASVSDTETGWQTQESKG